MRGFEIGRFPGGSTSSELQNLGISEIPSGFFRDYFWKKFFQIFPNFSKNIFLKIWKNFFGKIWEKFGKIGKTFFQKQSLCQGHQKSPLVCLTFTQFTKHFDYPPKLPVLCDNIDKNLKICVNPSHFNVMSSSSQITFTTCVTMTLFTEHFH